MAGSYSPELLRTTVARATVVPTYTTLRLRAQSRLLNVSGLERQNVTVTFVNESAEDTTVRLRMTSDIVSGPRENVGGDVLVRGGGERSVNVNLRREVLELYGVAGRAQLRMQFSSRIRFDQLGFDRKDSRYPQELWAQSSKTLNA
jgi:hypothetical protein